MKEQREPRCRLRKGSPSPFLAAVLLTIGAAQSAGAYEFTKPQTPTLPDNLPTQKLEVTPDTSKYASQNPNGSGYDWYGSNPKSRSKRSRYSSENDVLIEKSVKYTDFFLLSIVYV